jgi:hypothetical protein
LPQPPLFGVVELAVVESPTRTKEASMSLSLLWPLPLPLPLLRAATSGAGMANAAGRSRAERRRCDSMVGGGSAVVRWVMDEPGVGPSHRPLVLVILGRVLDIDGGQPDGCDRPASGAVDEPDPTRKRG